MTGDAGLRVGLLGPLLVSRVGVQVRLPPGRAGVLLAVLAMSAGRSVGVDRLARLIWDDDQPERPRASLHTVATRLRRIVPGALVTVSDGYLLDVDPDRVDLLRFRRLVREAGEADGPAPALGVLDEALKLWRGELLADLRSTALNRDVVPSLTDEYLSAVQQRAGLHLAVGHGDRVITELRGLTSRYPMREPLWGLLVHALAAAGRPAEAISEYHRLRELLSSQLGLDPAPELRELYQRLLQGDGQRTAVAESPGTTAEPSPVAAMPLPPASDGPTAGGSADGVPRRLPADTAMFTGRQAEVMRLLDLGGAPDDARGPGAVVISAIDGMAGVGKTALAVHAAHRLAGRFPDGQLFIDLHGYTQGYPPRTADQALETFLLTLGVPPQQIPPGTDERAALYRERLAGTRTLIVLDNAVDEAQVRPLIPGDAGCLVLIASRRKLKSLDDAHIVALNVLPQADAAALLSAVAGPGRAPTDDTAAAEIVSLCGRLPLAVRIAGALLRNRPAWTLAHLAAKLRAEQTRLDALADGDRDLAAVFGLSTRNLRDGQQRLYRCLSLIPGPDTDAYAAAALADTDPAAVDRLLQNLVDHNLLQEPMAGRYEMHDLIRAHARAMAADDPAEEREAALSRLLGYYQHTALRADARIARYARAASAGPAPAYAPALPDPDTAREWLRTERANLAACLRYAIDGGLDERTVELAVGVATLLRTDGPWPQATVPHAAAATAAARLGDRSRQARALTELGSLQRLTGDYPSATHSLRAALELCQETDDQSGQARAQTELGSLQRLTGDYPSATHSLRAALELYRSVGDAPGQAQALGELGIIQSTVANYQDAGQSLRAALELYRNVGDTPGQVRVLTELSELQRLTGDYQAAAQNGEAAVALSKEQGDRLGQANALLRLGNIRRMTGDYESAARHQEAALKLYQELGARLGQANALTRLAEVQGLTGDYKGATQKLERSIRTFRDLGIIGNQADALNCYAAVISAAGNPARAVAVYQDSLRLARQVRQPDEEATALHGLGENYLRTGKIEDAAACLSEALVIYRKLGMPAADQVAKRLTEIRT